MRQNVQQQQNYTLDIIGTRLQTLMTMPDILVSCAACIICKCPLLPGLNCRFCIHWQEVLIWKTLEIQVCSSAGQQLRLYTSGVALIVQDYYSGTPSLEHKGGPYGLLIERVLLNLRLVNFILSLLSNYPKSLTIMQLVTRTCYKTNNVPYPDSILN